MTIFRSDLIDIDKLTFQFVSANDPDTIGVEVMLDDNVLIDMSMDADGRTSVLFDADGAITEFDLNELRGLLSRCEADLTAWRERLAKPGAIWSAE